MSRCRNFRRSSLALLLAWGFAAIGPLNAAERRPELSTASALALPADEYGLAATRVDRLLADEIGWTSSAEKLLAPRTDDATFVRRLSLDLRGRAPTSSEATLFVLDPTINKRQQLIERWLADRSFGEAWARYWRDVIFSRRADDRVLITSQAAEEFLAERFNENVGWDRIARELIAGTGNLAEAGETALLAAQIASDNDVAAEVSRIFLGIQISCAQCHDHPTDRWKREQFHEFAAFFPRVQLRPVLTDGRVRGFEIASLDTAPRFRRPDAAGRGSLEHQMPDLKNPNEPGTVMTPVFFVTGERLYTGAADLDRRETLGGWLTAAGNPWFSKALVNRFWAELVGEGFYEPVDDLGPDRPCSAPRTLDYLAEQFIAHQYDLKWLLRTIFTTEAYQRASRPRRKANESPFTANVAQPLRADQVYDNLVLALGVEFPGAGARRPAFGAQLANQNSPRRQFSQLFGYDPSVRRESVTGNVPQALMLMNSPLLTRGFSASDRSSVVARLITDFPAPADDAALTSELFLRCLTREPTPAELRLCVDYLRSGERRAEAVEDLAWSLVNRAEFLQRP